MQAINILKAHGQSVRDSYLLNGYALNTGRAAQGMPLRVSPARIACLDINLQKSKMQMGVQVLVSDPKELEKIVIGINEYTRQLGTTQCEKYFCTKSDKKGCLLMFIMSYM